MAEERARAGARKDGPDTATSLGRMMRVLDIVEEGPPAIGFEEMLSRLGFTRSTLYRYLKILSDAGLLTSLPEVGYMLGPRIAELDFRMRDRDPLILASRAPMQDLAASVCGIALLCRRYRDRVLCVHQERGGESLAGFRSTYERGRPRPLLRGAASVIILAHMPGAALARLYEAQAAGFAAAGLGDSLAEVRAGLRRLRREGWIATEGQVTPGVTGIAAPVFDGKAAILGSLSVTVARTGMAPAARDAVGERVSALARQVTRLVSAGAAPAGQSRMPSAEAARTSAPIPHRGT